VLNLPSTAPADARPPAFSVIIPAHNTAEFVREALDSVRAQTCQDFEVIVVDDGSTDDTWPVIQGCAAWFPGRFRSTRIEPPRNKGPGGARNLALRQAKGEFVAFLDSDDTWVREHLGRAYDNLMRRGQNAGLFAGRTWNLGTQEFSHDFNWPGPEPQPASRELLHGCYFHTSSVCTQRQIVIDIGGFHEGLVCWEDWVFFLEASKRTLFLHSPCVENMYRRRDSSATTTGNRMSKAQYRDRIRAYLILAESGVWNQVELGIMREHFVRQCAGELADYLCSFNRASARWVIDGLLMSGLAGGRLWLPILSRAGRQFLTRGMRKAIRLRPTRSLGR
jgi:glycosyltransferase involved in cell wall biosynthesis